MGEAQQHDLAIIGGGPSALAILSSFLELGERATLPASIVIFESKPLDEMGRGIWAKDGAIESHLMLNPGPRTSRLENGDKLNDEFFRKVQQLEKRGVAVTVQSGAQVTACKRSGNTHTITFKDKEGEHTALSRATVLATGHFKETSAHDGRSDYAPAYPAKRAMDAMSNSGTTVALGTGPTGVDVALAWADKFGSFTRGKEGLIFTPNNKTDARIVMASPSGMLPKVMEASSLTAAKGTHRYLNNENIALLRRNGKGTVSLDDVISLAAKDLADINPDHYLADRLREAAKKGGLSLSGALKALTPTESPDVTLMRDVDVAFGGTGRLRDKGPGMLARLFSSKAHSSAWQAELSLNPVLSEASQYFSAEDVQKFQELKSLLTGFAAPIPPENAEKLLAMFQAKNARGEPVLQVAKLVSKEPPRHDATNGYVLKTDKGDLHADTLIDGVPGKDIRRHPSPLMKQMLEDGLIQPGHVRFKDSAAEQRAAQVLAAKPNSPYMKAGDATVLRTDGIMVDPQSRAVIPAIAQDKDAPPLMAMGNLVANRLLTSMGMLKADAMQIAQELSRSLQSSEKAAGEVRLKPRGSYTQEALSSRSVIRESP